MDFRIYFVSPGGPLCYIEYQSYEAARAIMDGIKKAAQSISEQAQYSFRFFKKSKDGFEREEEAYCRGIDSDSMQVYLQSVD